MKGVTMYRPPSFDNPHALKKGQIGITDPFCVRVLLKNAYEAGADAMLDGLRKQKPTFPDVLHHFIIRKIGKLVFIPEEA